MGKIKLKKAHVSEVNLYSYIDEEFDITFKNLKEVVDNFYILKPDKEYNNECFFLSRDIDKKIQFIHFNIPLLLNNSDYSKVGTEKVFRVEMLIQNKIETSVLYTLIYSFKFEGFKSIDCTFEEYINKIDRIPNFDLKERNEHSLVYQNDKLELEYVISDPKKMAQVNGCDSSKHYPKGNLLKHQVLFKKPLNFFKREVRFAHLEHGAFRSECKDVLKNLVESIEFKKLVE